MNRLLFSRYLLVILTLSHASLSWSQLAIAPANPVATEAGPLAHVTVKLPIRLYWGYLVVIEASIGNIRKLNFLVDTGAYPSVIDQKIARRLGLAEQPARVNLSKNSVETRLVVLPSLLLGPIRADSLRVLSEDLSFIQKTVGHKVDGIVGLDVLRKSSPETTGLQTLGTEEITDVSGTFQLRKVRIPEVYLGKEPLGEQVAFVVDDRKDDGDNFDGVLGIKGPQFWKIALDFEHRRFSWERSAVVPAISVAIYNDVQP